jgi:hypothetical protein
MATRLTCQPHAVLPSGLYAELEVERVVDGMAQNSDLEPKSRGLLDLVPRNYLQYGVALTIDAGRVTSIMDGDRSGYESPNAYEASSTLYVNF